MESPATRSYGTGDSAPTTAAERLLAALHPTCSHDLPNQILSLQSLINLMDMDEVDHLDAAGREYLLRLKAVSDKMAGMVDFLRSMVRLVRHVPQPREIVLADVFRELKAEARSLLETPLTWDVRLLAGSVRADRDLVYPSLGDLLRAMAEGVDAKIPKTVTVTSTAGSMRTFVEIAVRGPGVHKMADTLGRRGDFLLARERLFVAGVELKLGPPRADETSVILEFAALAGKPETT